jgi:predicted HTH domain antitoxin
VGDDVTDPGDLTQPQIQALAAYRRGDISTGKLAEVMGMPAVHVRSWLAEHDIPHNSSYGEEDAANA